MKLNIMKLTDNQLRILTLESLHEMKKRFGVDPVKIGRDAITTKKSLLLRKSFIINSEAIE